MRLIRLAFLILITTTACNLATIPPTPPPTDAPVFTETPPVIATITLVVPGNQPTSLPLPSLPATFVPVTSVPVLGRFCQVYITYSGARADNKLSLRSAPSVDAVQLFRVPNQVQVLRVPDSQEIVAEDYHWLNVIYEESAQMHYWGWIARDSFEVNGVRDPSIATLRPTGTQGPC